MESTIVSSLIEAVPALITAVGGVAGGVAWNRNKVKKVQASVLLAQSATIHEQQIEVYGFKAKRLKASAKILDETGLTTFTRKFEEISVTGSQRVQLLCHESELSTRPDQLPELLESSSPYVSIRSKPSNWSGGRCKVIVHLEPDGLAPGQYASYSLQHTAPSAQFVNKEDIAQRYKDDTFKMEFQAGRIPFPVDELIVEVEFPVGKVCQCQVVVFMPRTEIPHNLAKEALKGELKANGRMATLTVKNPLIEFGYAICWSGC